MFNKYLRPVSSTLLANKLSVLATKLQAAAKPTGSLDYPTLESTTTEARQILTNLFRDLNAPLFTLQPVLRDTEPEAAQWNYDFENIGYDLEVLFAEFENLEGVVLGNFNSMISRLNRLHGKLKKINNDLGNYIMYATAGNKDSLFLGDAFGNSNYVDLNSKSLSKDQLEIDTSEGVVTLPLDKSKQKQIRIAETPIINSVSNGTLGNSEEAKATSYTDLKTILDGNADTWVEYERVVTTDDGVALVLDLTVNLGKDEVINFIGINPYHFGTKTQLEISALETSLDGKIYVSIQKDMAITQGTNPFELSSSAGKYAGQGLFSFLPRQVRYIHFTLKQKTPYTITTTTGLTKFRYAIGIRDISVEARYFKTEGEFISKAFSSSDEIRKVALLVTGTPSQESKLVTLTHSISPDDGTTWQTIEPKSATAKGVTLLDFNGIDTKTIKTASPVYSLRYRLKMARNASAFSSTTTSKELAQTYTNVTELHQIPSTTPFTIDLQQTPVDGEVKIVDPAFGSRGIDSIQYKIGVGRGAAAYQVLRLPWQQIPLDWVKGGTAGSYTISATPSEKVSVDTELWSPGVLAINASTSKVYEMDHYDGTLRFGNGTYGLCPVSGASINLNFSEERLYPGAKKPHEALLAFPTVADVKQITVKQYDQIASTTTALVKGARRHQLKPMVSSSLTITFSDTTTFSSLQTFVNGSIELTATGQYSIDYTNGILYSYDAISSSGESSVTYYYTPYTTIQESLLAFSNHGIGLANGITIDEKAWKTLVPPSSETIPTGVKYFNLGNLAVVAGSLIFSPANSVFSKEVAFIDGRTELLGVTKTTETISSLSAGAYPGNVSFTLKLKITSVAGFTVSFSDKTIFVAEKNTLAGVTSVGDYFVDKTSSPPTVVARLSAAASVPGTVSYYYDNPTVNLTGRYSVDYQKGEVFTFDATPASTTVTYQYTDYRIAYPIAREVSSGDFTVDATKKQITLSDREILKNKQVQTGDAGQKYYQVSYRYISSSQGDLKSLENFFSPIITDYYMKTLTASKLV